MSDSPDDIMKRREERLKVNGSNGAHGKAGTKRKASREAIQQAQMQALENMGQQQQSPQFPVGIRWKRLQDGYVPVAVFGVLQVELKGVRPHANLLHMEREMIVRAMNNEIARLLFGEPFEIESDDKIEENAKWSKLPYLLKDDEGKWQMSDGSLPEGDFVG